MKSLIILLGVIFFFNKGPDRYPDSTKVCLSIEEKKLYERIMTYRSQKKLKPIPLSALLTTVAQVHVGDLTNHFNYENNQGCNPHSWSDHGPWTSCCYTADHRYAKCMWDKPKEITGYQGDGFEIAYYSSAEATAEEGLEGWKKSPGHNPLLINSETWSKVEWKAIGVGINGHYAAVWFGEVEDKTEMTSCP